MKKLLAFLPVAAMLAGCAHECRTDRHAEWTYDAVVYEMNVRQSTAEGTFAAAETRLSELRDLGADIVWLMPIHPIGEKGRKGSLGSYYAIRDYYDVNPEFGTMSDFEHFLDKAHSLGLRVILDYVANHTSPDAAWVDEKPADWYVRDSLGNTVVQYDWTDIAKLNYENADLRREMKRVLHFWTDKGVDGFRCDAAKEMPDGFWREALVELRAKNPDIYLLAEGEGANFHENGFDATYAWELHHLMNDVAQGKKSAADIADYVVRDAERSPRDAFRLMFTSNHDENSWAGTEFERMGDAAGAMAVLTYLLPNGQPLIYTGQEIGFARRFAFFDKDCVDDWTPNAFTEFYRRMNALRHANPALDAGEKGAPMRLLPHDEPQRLLAFVRESGDNGVVALLNLSPEPIVAKVDFSGVEGEYTDFATGERRTVNVGDEYEMNGWSYIILTR